MKNVLRYSGYILLLVLFFGVTLLYLFPLLQGLILLPLDLLVTSYSPWNMIGQILLKNPYMQDSVVQLFPWHHLTYESLMNGIIPLWNPYGQFGMPFMANLKSMIFYPLNVFFLFGEIKAWNMLLFSQFFLSLLFTYALAREFSLKKAPSILLAFAFSFNSYMIGLLEFGSDAQTLLWWPLLLLFIKRYMDKKDAKNLVFFSFALAFSIFAGQLQYIGYFLVMLCAFVFFYGRSRQVSISTYLFILLGLLLGMGISGIQLIPAMELFKYSHRGLLDSAQNHQVFSRGLMPFQDILRLFSPDFFGNPATRDLSIGYIETSGYFGIVPLFFAVIAMLFERKNKIVLFFVWVFLVSLLLSLQGFGEILYFLKIPLLTSGSGERIFTLVLFSGAILSGFGFESFLYTLSQKKRLISAGIFTVSTFFIVGIYAFLVHKTQSTFLHNVSFSLFILVAFFALIILWILSRFVKNKIKLFTILFAISILAVTFFDLFRLGYRFLTFSNEKFFYPQMPVVAYIQDNTRVSLGRTYGLVEPEINTYLHIYSIDTYNPLYPMRSALLLQALQGKSQEKLSVDNKYFITVDGDKLKRTLDFLGVSYVVIGRYKNPSMEYFHTRKFEASLEKVYQDDAYIVFKNNDANPRYELFYKTKTIRSEKQLLSQIGSSENKDTLFLEENLPTELTDGTGSAVLTKSDVNSQTFQVQSSTDAMLYVSDTYFPGWHASVNGKETKIYRANYNFRAIHIPQGNSTVRFWYFPVSYIVGITLSSASILIVVCIVSYVLLKGKKAKKRS